MRYHQISEAGVKTSDVDRAARAAIDEHLPDVVKAIATEASPSIGDYDVAFNSEDGEDRHTYYQLLYDWVKDNREAVTKRICAVLSEVLSRVTRKIATERAKDEPRINLANIKRIKTEVEASEYSSDEHRHHAGGYQSEWKELIKVFVEGDKVVYAALGVIQEDLFGEETEGYKNEFVNAVVPIYCHEYAHFEQTLRVGRIRSSDLGYITLGSSRKRVDGKRRGKRGGFHRDTKSTESYLRYMGSTHEIDAWASGAASEMVQEIRRRYIHSDRDYNSAIKDLLRSLAHDWADSKSYNNYRQHYLRAIEGEYPGLKQEEMTKVWHRFMLTLISKLTDYTHPMIGKMTAEEAKRFDKHWIERAQKYNFAQMIEFLARVVGTRIAWQHKHDSSERITQEIDQGYGGGYEGPQHKGEEFIRNYYFGADWWDHQAQLDKLIAIFRRMLKREALNITFTTGTGKRDAG